MARGIAITATLGLLTSSWGPAAAGQSPTPSNLYCSAQAGKPLAVASAPEERETKAKRKKKAKKKYPKIETAVLRLSCNFQLSVLAFYAGRRTVPSVDPVAQLSGAASSDRLDCSQVSADASSCQGNVTPGAVIRIGFVVKPGLCRKPRPQFLISAIEYQAPCSGPGVCPSVGPRITNPDPGGVVGCS